MSSEHGGIQSETFTNVLFVYTTQCAIKYYLINEVRDSLHLHIPKQ